MGDPEFQDEDPNFRQIGTRTAGRLLLGNAHHHVGHTTSSSIPSKFETVLYTGDAENDAFHSRTSRFKPTQVDLPGPGAYHQPASMNWEKSSLSQKGFGNGFVSKTQRFYNVPGPTNAGPGSYGHADWLEQKERHDFNRMETTGPFKDSVAGPLAADTVANNAVPGPGTYQEDALQIVRGSRRTRLPATHSKSLRNKSLKGSKKRTKKKNRAVTGPSVPNKGKDVLTGQDVHFGSTVDRFLTHDRKVPAPGTYNPAHQGTIEANTMTAWFHQDIPSAPFRSTSDRVNIEGGDTMFNPGPGHYRPGEANELTKLEREAAAHSTFKPTGNTRFGEPLRRRVQPDNFPGPGSYDSTQTKTLKGPGAKEIPPLVKKRESEAYAVGGVGLGGTSGTGRMSLDSRMTRNLAVQRQHRMIMSRSSASISAAIQKEIIASSKIKPPGPAYYNPDKLLVREKRSFHLNTAHRWS